MRVYSNPRPRLKSRTSYPVGDFQMCHPEAGQSKPWRGSFSHIVMQETVFRRGNPSLGLSLDHADIERDVDLHNAQRMLDGGYTGFLHLPIDAPRKPDSNVLQQAPAFVQLGRFGDLILLLPAWKAWADLTGAPVNVVTTKEFGTVFEGVTYVTPTLLPINWQTGIHQAIAVANTLAPCLIVTQLHGMDWTPPQPDSLASYSLTMWKRTGFLAEYATLPLVFDRRNIVREAILIKQHFRQSKAVLLVNLESWTSPIRGQAMQSLQAMLGRLPAQIVHLNKARATRVFDQLALMDAAAGMLTCDTMPLHLAAASVMPYIALTRDDGQSGSVPKGNCRLQVGYSQITRRLPDIEDTLRSFLVRTPIYA